MDTHKVVYNVTRHGYRIQVIQNEQARRNSFTAKLIAPNGNTTEHPGWNSRETAISIATQMFEGVW